MGQDVRDLLGMRSVAALVMTGIYMLACLVLAAFTSAYMHLWWPIFVAALILSVASYVLVTSAGDPMPLGQCFAVGLGGAAACGLGLWKLDLPVEHVISMWPLGMSTLLFTFMCVRGRVLAAWLCFVAMIGVCVVWSALTGQGAMHGVAMSFINAGPLLMSTFFAYTIRPLGSSIYQLRAQSTRRIADEAATAAVLEARDAKLNELDQLARPLLERIASGAPLGCEERTACELLEARLRDGLRAPGLQRPDVVAAARAARSRGVVVVMLDDRGMDGGPAELHTRLAEEVVAELDAVADGTVTVRILPPRRKVMATILVSGEHVRRVEFDRVGARLVTE
ncbi:hypothetical protein [Tomitella biformata]|uniref:hypothetical protein n=1 Tax=Tomitella biformata TaxID=630403 RepID=UPI0004BAD71B|nr:hypothetical protein [Tomitella biformata]